MPRVQLKLNAAASEDWLASLSIEYPDAEFKVLASHPTNDGLLGIVEVTTLDTSDIIRDFKDAPEVYSYEVVHTDEQMVLIQYVVPMPGTYDALRVSGNLPRFPAIIRDGWLLSELTASQERLSEFTDVLAATGVPYQIVSLTQSYKSSELLTTRQWEFITEAFKHGYYETPRECTLTELAETFTVNKSAASGILRRAERQIIGEFVAEAADN